MPRLGGRFPPPDQFSQSILAIAAPPDETNNHPLCSCLCCSAGQPKIPTKQLPGIDIERDDQTLQDLFASRALEGAQLLFESLADPRTKVPPPGLKMLMHRR